MKRIAHLEGTTLEGGGQLLRLSLGLSALTGIPLRIDNIRGRRSGGGGLKHQHLTGVNWLAKACSAETVGAEHKSKILEFTPKRMVDSQPDLYRERVLLDGSRIVECTISQNTPGAIGLVFQAVLPFILFSGQHLSSADGIPNPPKYVRLTITGGTNVSMSPSYEYISQVLLPTLSLIGLPTIRPRLISRGWSTGRVSLGEIQFEIEPLPPNKPFPAFNLENRGEITDIKATFLVPPVCETHAREELKSTIRSRLGKLLQNPQGQVNISVSFEDSGHPKRLYLLLVATTSNGHELGRDWLYDGKLKGVDTSTEALFVAASRLVSRVVGDLATELSHGGCVDEYMRDQIVVFQALAEGVSHVDVGKMEDGRSVKPSLHTRTAWWVAEQMLGTTFDGDGKVEGVGFVMDQKGGRHLEEDVAGEMESLSLSW
ncbi:RNA 3'-terminal phosphate cyclase [Patellaria atrata CBS 101060]|uniref:RNA 3'-terminal phosphate cyclase n=1 Tax=Patellaria atrata CBS 101060 TaxID=1346257 RepID=A0A9P4SAV7_9PEZI|nr:RNA 3'-terminal phosphate cyclase [Patellaria atrata CBS 101060]